MSAGDTPPVRYRVFGPRGPGGSVGGGGKTVSVFADAAGDLLARAAGAGTPLSVFVEAAGLDGVGGGGSMSAPEVKNHNAARMTTAAPMTSGQTAAPRRGAGGVEGGSAMTLHRGWTRGGPKRGARHESAARPGRWP